MNHDKIKDALTDIATHQHLFSAFENNMTELYHQMNILGLVFENLQRSLVLINELHKKVREITKE